MQTGNTFILKNAGPRAVAIAFLLLLIPSAIILAIQKVKQLNDIVTFQKFMYFDVIYLYYFVMLCATIWLAVSFKHVGTFWIQWPSSIKITKVKLIFFYFLVIMCLTE